MYPSLVKPAGARKMAPAARRRTTSPRPNRSSRSWPPCRFNSACRQEVSHKLTTYLDASIPSCSWLGGSPSVGEETGGTPVVRWRSAGFWSALLQASIECRATIYPRFMPVYADLFYDKCLILLHLHGFGQFFSSKWPVALQHGRLPAIAAGWCRQGSCRSGNVKIDAFYYDGNLCLSAPGSVIPSVAQVRRERRP